jgi:hypothetical protein
LEKPSNRMGWDLDHMVDILMGFHQSTFSKLNTEFNSYLASCHCWEHFWNSFCRIAFTAIITVFFFMDVVSILKSLSL